MAKLGLSHPFPAMGPDLGSLGRSDSCLSDPRNSILRSRALSRYRVGCGRLSTGVALPPRPAAGDARGMERARAIVISAVSDSYRRRGIGGVPAVGLFR